MIPGNIIANADDFGLNPSINKAILYCFEKGYINSTSLMTNTPSFEEAVNIFHANPTMICNIGVHVNISEGKPLTNFNQVKFLDADGNWNNPKILNKKQILTSDAKAAFSKEIYAQIDKAIANKVPVVHLDSHFHSHTLPCFYNIFLGAAKFFNLKIRLAQTYNEGNYFKFYYRKFINSAFKRGGNNYTDLFDVVTNFLQHTDSLNKGKTIEIMLHPDFSKSGVLYDHFDVRNFKIQDPKSIEDWISFLNN